MPSTARLPLLHRPPQPAPASSARIVALPLRSAPDVAAQQASARLAELIQAVARLDRQAFRALYDATCNHLMSVAYTVLGQRELAEEVLQDAYVKVWNHAESYDPDRAAPMTWLISIVRHRAIDVRRARVGESTSIVQVGDEQFEQLADATANGACDVLHLLQRRAVEMGIRSCLATLSAEQRQAVALVIYRGMTHTEIARLCGVPLSTAKTWVRRGLARLAECVEARA